MDFVKHQSKSLAVKRMPNRWGSRFSWGEMQVDSAHRSFIWKKGKSMQEVPNRVKSFLVSGCYKFVVSAKVRAKEQECECFFKIESRVKGRYIWPSRHRPYRF